MIHQVALRVDTKGRGTYPITSPVKAAVAESGIETGLCHVFVRHTSASLILCENADPAVRADLERFLARVAPDGDPMYAHDDEGPDDMPAHIRSILTNMDLTIPVVDGHCALGTWQGVYLYEHRTHAHRRDVIVSVSG